MRSMFTFLLAPCLLAYAPILGTAPACDLCTAAGQPLSWEINGAKLVVFGNVANARLGPDGINGTTELKIDALIKAEPRYKDLKSITIPKYVPTDPKVKGYLVFLDAPKGQLDPYRGMPFATDRVVKYLQESPTWLDDKAAVDRRAERLLYYFKHLNDPESEIALDAFKEWAMAGNREVGTIADKVSAQDLREWLMNPKTPSNRLSLYAFLLGACGTERDAELLKRFVITPDDRVGSALDGLLAGFIRLRPEEGWKLTEDVINDTKRPFTQRHAVLRMLRFYYGYQPEQYRARVLRCSSLMLNQPDIHDLAVDQLWKWKLWDLTDQVLALWGRKEADAPITKRTIVRYALLCPDAKAKGFIEVVRQQDPKTLKEVQESLRFELDK